MKANEAIRKGANIRISEIYSSRQGEGLLTGTPSVFVRTSGCNLRCWFCDTPFASWKPEGDSLSIETITARVAAMEIDHIVLTGGEPMIFSQLPELCQALRQGGPDARGRHITIETAGTVYHDLECDLVSISPKLSRSGPGAHPSGETPSELSSKWTGLHEQRREKLDVVRQLIANHDYQLKFVVDTPGDAEEVLEYLERLGSWQGERVLLMPQGITVDELTARESWLVPWCKRHSLQYCPRQHIHWYGNQRGT